jgi:sugar O-acyltransferase (sialic acid O-acetyltransferase NeuD family)
MKKLAIIGSSDLAQLVIHHAVESKQFVVCGIYDDFSKPGKLISDIPVIGTLDDVKKDYGKKNFDYLFVAIGYSRMEYRETVFNRFKNIIPFANIIHGSCTVDPTVELGEGVFLFPGVILDKGVKLGDNVLLNVGVTIAHDSSVNEHCFLGPRVSIAGFTHIESKCYVGTNATIIDNIRICSGVVIGAGAVTIKNICEAGVYVGVPSKKIK